MLCNDFSTLEYSKSTEIADFCLRLRFNLVHFICPSLNLYYQALLMRSKKNNTFIVAWFWKIYTMPCNTDPMLLKLSSSINYLAFNPTNICHTFPASPRLLHLVFGPKIQTVCIYFKLLDGLSLEVGPGIEVPEQHNERDHVPNQGVVHPQREFTSHQYAVDAQGEGTGELDLKWNEMLSCGSCCELFRFGNYQLQDGQVLLPPQVFVHVWSQGGQSVVCVHQNVNERVDHGGEESCGRKTVISNIILKSKTTTLTASTGNPLDANPPKRKHGTVVVHVQECQLVVLFA